MSAAALVIFDLIVRGALTLETGVGRRNRPLGPIHLQVAADPETTFDVIAAPYLEKTPRAMAQKLRVIERGSDMVLAEHFTQVGKKRRTTTVETVRFERPTRVFFRLVRGPVPGVTEVFELAPSEIGTSFIYTGTLETDFWGLGEKWGSIVAKQWEETVRTSANGIKTEAERRAHAGA